MVGGEAQTHTSGVGGWERRGEEQVGLDRWWDNKDDPPPPSRTYAGPEKTFGSMIIP